MDPRHFDTFVKSAATGLPRRTLLRALVAGALGAALVGREPGRAATCGKDKDRCDEDHPCCGGATCFNGRCRCKAGLRPACGRCLDLDHDQKNCGECGRVCPGSQICCNGTCVNPNIDGSHCGQCGQVCGNFQTCRAGVCECPRDWVNCGGTCCSNGAYCRFNGRRDVCACPEGMILCNGTTCVVRGEGGCGARFP
jgi:hypothetical protein